MSMTANAARDEQTRTAFMTALMKDFTIKDLGTIDSMFGIEMLQLDDGSVRLTQTLIFRTCFSNTIAFRSHLIFPLYQLIMHWLFPNN